MPPGDAREQNEDDRVEARTAIDARTAASGLWQMFREQRANRLPQLVTHLPGRPRHKNTSPTGFARQASILPTAGIETASNS